MKESSKNGKNNWETGIHVSWVWIVGNSPSAETVVSGVERVDKLLKGKMHYCE